MLPLVITLRHANGEKKVMEIVLACTWSTVSSISKAINFEVHGPRDNEHTALAPIPLRCSW